MRGKSLILGLAMAAIAPLGLGADKFLQTAQVSEYKRRRSMHSSHDSAPSYGRKGPGWTVAHVKRMAQKRRNRIRNKAALKGGTA